MKPKIACAFVAGSGHLQEGVPCQDSATSASGSQADCIALADGAGSSPHSEIAAQAVTACLTRTLAEHFDAWYALSDEELKVQLLRTASGSVLETELPAAPDCTLLLFARAPDGRCLLAHLGDGAALAVLNGGSMLLSAPENGIERNITYFVSSSDAAQHLRLLRMLPTGCHTVLLCSDGVSGALADECTGQVAPAAAHLARMTATLSRNEVERGLREDLDTTFRRHSPDDMSLAIFCLNPDRASLSLSAAVIPPPPAPR